MDGLRNSEYRHIEVSRIAGSLGAEVTGVDLSEDLAEEVMGEIRSALLDHLVIFFRDQRLTPETQLAFARRWGEIASTPTWPGWTTTGGAGDREDAGRQKEFRGSWHSDQAFTPRPGDGDDPLWQGDPLGRRRYAWTNLYAAYEALSPGMQRMLDGSEESVYQRR